MRAPGLFVFIVCGAGSSWQVDCKCGMVREDAEPYLAEHVSVERSKDHGTVRKRRMGFH